jgi:ubiquitin carboxyl-terminal hydrolase 1
MSNYGQYSFEDLHRPQRAHDSGTSLTWILLTTVFGAYILFNALELAGYHLWPRISHIAHMTTDSLGLRLTASDSSDTAQGDDTMQSTGGLFSSMFGRSSESLLLKGVRGFKGAFSSGPSTTPPGLCNRSNSCYQNSVIQGLAALPSLREYLSTMTTEHPSFTTDTTGGALHELITKLNNPDSLGQSFWVKGKLSSMSTWTQQDAQEYYSKILDELDNEVKKASSSKRRSSVSWVEATKNLSGSPVIEKGANADDAETPKQDETATASIKIVPNPLDGLIAQRVGCTSCGYSEGLSLINFNCITVSLGRNNSYDIRDCLDEYTKLEYIDGVECAKCTLLKQQRILTPLATANPGSPFAAKLTTVSELLEDDKFDDNHLVKTLNIPKKNWVQSSKSKQIVVARAPKSLVLHVNRSIFDEMTGQMYKNTAGVSYPKILDLGDWCLGNAPSGSRRPDMSLEEWPRDPTQSMLQGACQPTTSPFQYRLRAAVTHFGSHGNGHYICYRPHTRISTEPGESDPDVQVVSTEEQWWRCSDDNVYAVDEDQAHQANVFMLFYERLDASTESQSTEVEPVRVMVPVADDAPLPPSDLESDYILVAPSDAEGIPLPDDDDLLELIRPESPSFEMPEDSPSYAKGTATTKEEESVPRAFEPLIAAPLENDSHDTEAETSEAESEDAPSTQQTSDSEAELVSPPTPKPIMRVPPHLMRTAGNATSRQGSRQSLPLVSAT